MSKRKRNRNYQCKRGIERERKGQTNRQREKDTVREIES